MTQRNTPKTHAESCIPNTEHDLAETELSSLIDSLSTPFSAFPLHEENAHLLDNELSFISQCLSQNLIRRFQSVALICYITYAMIHGLNSIPSFYILAVANLLPYILFSMAGDRAHRRIQFFPQLKKSLHIAPERFPTNRYSQAFVTFLLLLWQLVQTRTSFAYPFLTWYPGVLATLTVLATLLLPSILTLILKSRLKQGRI